MEFWLPETTESIGNNLGAFVKIFEATKFAHYTSYARIYIYLNISQPFLGEIYLVRNSEEWIQIINYEHIPF